MGFESMQARASRVLSQDKVAHVESFMAQAITLSKIWLKVFISISYCYSLTDSSYIMCILY